MYAKLYDYAEEAGFYEKTLKSFCGTLIRRIRPIRWPFAHSELPGRELEGFVGIRGSSEKRVQ